MCPDGNETDYASQAAGSGLSKDPGDLVLCYLTCPQDAGKGFLGALMLTDSRSRPLHFSFVSPVRPTLLQRVLYGATLQEHVKIDVIAQKLLQEVSEVPDVLFVNSQELLMVRRIIGLPTAYLSKKESSGEAPGEFTALNYDTGGNAADQELVGQVLAALESQTDLVEPFARMTEALKEAIKAGEN